MLLIVTDAFSKWLKEKNTKTITEAATIPLLDGEFPIYGVALIIVSDNRINFSSAEFNNFLGQDWRQISQVYCFHYRAFITISWIIN